MKAREFYNKRLEENNTIGSVQLMEEYAEQKQNDIDELVESLAEANKQNFQLLQDKVKLEGEIINLKSRLSKYEN